MKLKIFTFAVVAILITPLTGQCQLNRGLIAWYPFNGNANDASGNGRNGALGNSPSFVAGPVSGNEAVQLVGQDAFGTSGQYVAIPSIDFSSMRSFTISLWANIQGISAPYEEALIAFGSIPNDTTGLVGNLGMVSIGYGVDGVTVFTSATTPQYLSFSAGYANAILPPLASTDWNQWHRYTMVYSGGQLTAYVDSQVVGTANGSVPSYDGNAGMGIHWWYAGAYDSTRFIGGIADVRIYNRALSSAEISQLAQVGSYSPPTITSVNVGPAGGGNLSMSIQGTNFGTAIAFNGTSPFLRIVDVTRNWEAGSTGDGVNVNVSAWTDTNIVINGFTGWVFNTPSYQFHAGDQLEAIVENPQTQNGFVTNTVTLNQAFLVVEIQPPQTTDGSTHYPMFFNTIEMGNLLSGITGQLQQEGLNNSAAVAGYVFPPSGPDELALLTKLCQALNNVNVEEQQRITSDDLREIFVSWLETAAKGDISGEVANWGLQTEANYANQMLVAAYDGFLEGELFQHGSCWNFGNTQISESPNFTMFPVVECGMKLRLIFPLKTLPQSPIDLRNVLGNMQYGEIANKNCSVIGTLGDLAACGDQVTFGPITEYSYSQNGDGTSLPLFTAYTKDVLWNDSSNVLTPSNPPSLLINTSNSPPNGGTNSGSGIAYSNSIVTVTATPNPGFSFSSWSENGFVVSLLSNYTFTATSNFTLVANFTTNFYTITTTRLQSDAGTTTGDTNAAFGTSVTVTANATNVSYAFGDWLDDNSNVVSTSSSYLITVNSDSNLVANFVPLGSSTITAVASPSSAGSVTGSGTYINGQNATLAATAAGCYSFVNWTTNGTTFSISPTNTFTVTTNLIFTANFAPITYNIAISSSAGGTANGGGSYDCGAGVTFHAAPSPCYSFVNWTENGSPVSGLADFFFVVDTNHNFVANFAPITNNISTSASPANGGLASGGGAVGCEANVTVIAVANSGYSFVNWTVSGNIVSTSTNYTFTASGNQSLVANFAPNVPILGFASPPLYAGNLGLMLQGPVSSNYEIDASTDLFTWLPATNFILTSSPFYFSIPPATNANQGFYRALMQ
jgi:hypothetical protein